MGFMTLGGRSLFAFSRRLLAADREFVIARPAHQFAGFPSKSDRGVCATKSQTGLFEECPHEATSPSGRISITRPSGRGQDHGARRRCRDRPRSGVTCDSGMAVTFLGDLNVVGDGACESGVPLVPAIAFRQGWTTERGRDLAHPGGRLVARSGWI